MINLITIESARSLMPSSISRVESLKKNIERANAIIKKKAAENKDAASFMVDSLIETEDICYALKENGFTVSHKAYEFNGNIAYCVVVAW